MQVVIDTIRGSFDEFYTLSKTDDGKFQITDSQGIIEVIIEGYSSSKVSETFYGLTSFCHIDEND